MQRIATANRSVDLFGAGKDGFDGGDPLEGRDGTDMSAAWCNETQESIVRVIEAAGLTPTSPGYEQLLEAMGLVMQSSEQVYVNSSGVATPKTRTKTASALDGIYGSGWTVSNTYLTASSESTPWHLPLTFLPDGATVTTVDVMTEPATTNLMSVALVKRTLNWSSTSAGSESNVVTGNSSGSALQKITLNAAGETVDKSNGKILVVSVTASSGAGSDNNILYGVRVTYTDPGPRNF